MGQRVPPMAPFMGSQSYQTTTFCAYCRRQHAPDHTNCEGCGAPKTATGTGVLTFEGSLTDAEAENLKRHWERAFSGGTFWPMVPQNIVVRS